MQNCEVTILGAGPYGLAAAAHLRRVSGLQLRAFGVPMSFWSGHMPKGMLLRSSWEASHISDPDGAFTIDRYRSESGNHISPPVPLERFVEYGQWFQRKNVPDLDPRKIAKIEKGAKDFQIVLEDGKSFQSHRIVIAGGIQSFARRPSQFADVPSSLASHTSEQGDLRQFEDKKVIVIGSGQSALESAALLHEAGAEVEIIARGPEIHWLGWKARIQKLGLISKILYSWTDVGPAGISRLVSIPGLFQKLPRSTQDRLRKRSIRPAGSHWLSERLKTVQLTTGTSVISAVASGGRLHLVLSNRSERFVDHALLGTGYQVDATRYSFLSESILSQLRRTDGFPHLGKGFESSVSGLHFLGAPAAWSYGPLMYFVSGTRFSARNLASYVASNRAS
jgi:hypothetical protein